MQTYSFQDVSVSLTGPGVLASLGNGSSVAEEGITITANGDKNTMLIGADGNGIHSLHADKSGGLKVRLLKNSPMNQVLSAAYAFQTSSGAAHGQNTVVVGNKSSGDVITLSGVAFKKAPDITYAKEADIIEWDFDAIKVERTLGGA